MSQIPSTIESGQQAPPTPACINLDQASTSFPKAPGVAAAMARFIEQGAYNANRGSYGGALASDQLLFETRLQIAQFFEGKDPRHVIFSSGVTLSINQLLYGLLKEGDHVVTSSMEHNAVVRPLMRLARERGIEWSKVQADRVGRIDPEAVEAAIRPNTRLILMTAASNLVGTMTPLRAIGRIAREAGLFFAVDSAQLAGSRPLSMEKDQIDAICFTGHKALLGPQGIGGMVLSPALAEVLEPVICGGTGSFSDLERMPAPYPDRMEAGTLPLPAIAGLHAALHFLMEKGIDTLEAKKRETFRYLLSEMSKLPQIRLFGPTDPEAEDRVEVLAFQVAGQDSGAIAARLAERGILNRVGLHCAPWAHKSVGSFPEGSIRFSVGYQQRKADMDQALDVLREILDSPERG